MSWTLEGSVKLIPRVLGLPPPGVVCIEPHCHVPSRLYQHSLFNWKEKREDSVHAPIE